MFFVDDLDGRGTVAITHPDGSTESIVTLDDEALANRVVEHFNSFFDAYGYRLEGNNHE